ncbi:MAG: transposase [Burkholderiales bacterium]|nr:transposase [Burkholderiales bacterium]
MKAARYSDSQIMAILKQAEAGSTVSDLCREHGMSSASFYKWRAKFGGVSMMTRMKELEDENKRLKKMYIEAQMQADIIKEAMSEIL